jgi:hypothetical protein
MRNITESVEKLLFSKLQRRLKEKLDKQTCIEIYSDIFYTLSNLFEQSNIGLSNESVNLLSQIYYDTIKINNTEDLDPNIFSKKASFDEISSKELSLISSLFSGTDIGALFLFHLKKRS